MNSIYTFSSFCLTLLIILLLPTAAHGQVYKTTNEQGQVIFSDRPAEQAEQVDIKPVNIADEMELPEPPPDAQSEQQNEPDQQPLTYDVRIMSPADGAQIKSSQQDVMVKIDIYPPLQRGHGVQVYWNGYPETELGRSTSVLLENVSRRIAPQLRAVIKDQQEQVLAMSPPVTIHIKPRFLVAPVRPAAPRPVQLK